MSETNQPNQFSDFFVCGEIFSIFPCILIHISHSVSFPVVFHLLHSITFHSLFNHWICVYPFFLCLFVVFISPVSSQAVRNSYSRFVFCFYFYFSNTTHLALFQICIKHANLRLLTPLSHTIGHWNIDGFHSIFNCHRCVWHIYLWSVYFFKNINETEVVMRNTRDRHTFMVSERVSHNSFLDLFYFLYSLSLCIFLSLSLSFSFSFSPYLSLSLSLHSYHKTCEIEHIALSLDTNADLCAMLKYESPWRWMIGDPEYWSLFFPQIPNKIGVSTYYFNICHHFTLKTLK